MTPAETIARAVLNAYNRAPDRESGTNAAIAAATVELRRLLENERAHWLAVQALESVEIHRTHPTLPTVASCGTCHAMYATLQEAYDCRHGAKARDPKRRP